MSTPHVLLLGGHGKVALFLTPLILSRSWTLTSVIRNPDHESEIRKLSSNQPGKLNVLVDSLDEIKKASDAARVLDKVKPSVVVWAAGAGGKGGADRTKAIDEVAAKAYISASVKDKGVKKFMMISYIASRREKAPWWNDEDWESAQHVNQKILPAYYAAKVEADEHLLALSKRRRDEGDMSFRMINLRPGTLSDDKATGKVTLGKTSSRGKVPREEVAEVAAKLLDHDDAYGYFDMLEGGDDIDAAIEKLVNDKFDGTVGEDLKRIYARKDDI